MKFKDAREIVRLLDNEWDLGKKSSGGKKIYSITKNYLLVNKNYIILKKK